MLRKVLIANRGEIAVRIARTCRELGVASVAVYSEAERDALHVRVADEAHPCGPAPARESYLVGERLVEIARRAGADAVHPGYGFLSENGDFADACEAAGLRFVGPPGAVIRAMGHKVEARRVMQEAGVPVVPGTPALSDAEAAGRADALGYPVLVKASAGGGGRGMRRVDVPDRLAGALDRVRSEARSAFGEDSLYLERALDAPRHIEVQFLADGRGGGVHLGERECSIQRRHQKLLEEAPGNGVGPELREALGRAALTAAKAVGYRGAGTCEFLVDAAGEFYFLEMNTRIQVEHAVTECVTGIDTVAWMLRIAAGETLDLAQADVEIRGHAIEARIYAEDPARGFVPSPGPVTVFRPPGGFGVRVDSGVEEGSRVTTHYDPLIAKLVVWGADRPEALARLRRALAEFAVGGIRTTLPFHRRVADHPVFVSGRYATDFVEAHLAGGRGVAEDASAPELRPRAIRLAAIAAYRAEELAEGERVAFEIDERGGAELQVEVRGLGEGRYEVTGPGGTVVVDARARAECYSAVEDGRQLEAVVHRRGARGFDVVVADLALRLDVRSGDAQDD